MRILLFEDSGVDFFSPVALLRPVFELICGRESLRRRLRRWFPTAEFGVWIRPWLVETYAEEQPEVRVNDLGWIKQGPLLLINGRWLPQRRLSPLDFVTHRAGFLDGEPAWVLCSGDEFCELIQGELRLSLQSFAASHRVTSATGLIVDYPWDLICRNAEQLIRDFADEGLSHCPSREHVQILGDPADAYISSEAELDPYVVIDTRNGPVSVDRGAKIQSFTRIEGPCHVGRGSEIFRGLIRKGTTIGEQCRVGGEVEESILHAFVNKYHDGFLGHSYVCPWVNIGAMTCTSDLKNDYGVIQVPLQGLPVDTGCTKLGSFIGDHSRTAMDSMFNTGSFIGVMSMILPGGRLLPRHVPPFASVTWGELSQDWSLDSAIAAARVMMGRRGQELTAKAESLLRTVFQRTQSERQTALQRATRRRSAESLPS